MKSIIALLIALTLVPAQVASASKRPTLESKVRKAPVTQAWEPILQYYTGGYYGVSHVNSLWPYAPRGKRCQPVLDAAVRYRIPYKLLLGVWGAESGWGRGGSNYFGLIGPANGNLRHDAFYAAKLFNKFYHSWYHKDAVR
jgi:hypothetical protein